MDGISAEHKDLVWGYGIDNFWSDSIYDYDIIHIHWPDQILTSDLCKKESIGERLSELKSKGAIIVVTCHNFEPHYCNDNDKIEAYKSVYSHADCFIHLGDYSKRIMEVKYPQANHIVIYHHTYDKLYSTKNRTESLRYLGLNPKKKYILCFGAFRDEEEKELLDIVLNYYNNKGIEILSPNYIKIKRKSSRYNKIKKWLECRITEIRKPGLHIYGWSVRNEELPYYYGASDIALIQRKKVLNSGNLPMAFLMGKVVVGPEVGNVGEILKKTGNPSFNVLNNESVIDAVGRALDMSKGNKGYLNQKYANQYFSTSKISNQLYTLYNSLIKKDE
jgi:hypothetical protein